MLDERHRVVELQSIRGLASVVVLAAHCFSVYRVPGWLTNSKNILFNGQGAVVLFFTLSGFVLGCSLKNLPTNWRATSSFYVKRIFRIYPALWMASAIGFGYLVFFHFSAPHPDVTIWFMERFRRERLVPINFLAALAGCLGLLVTPVWSIFNELVNSAILPLTARLSFDQPRLGLALAAALGLLSVTIGPFTFYGVLLYPLDFQIGILLAVLFARSPQLKTPSKIWGLVFTLGVLASGCARGVALLFNPALVQNDPLMHLIELTGAAAIIAAANSGSVPLLRSRLTKSLGDISYSIYLLHFPIMCFIALGLANIPALRGQTPVETLLLFTLTLAATIAGATITYRLIELPCIALGKQVADRLRRGATPLAIASVEFGA